MLILLKMADVYDDDVWRIIIERAPVCDQLNMANICKHTYGHAEYYIKKRFAKITEINNRFVQFKKFNREELRMLLYILKPQLQKLIVHDKWRDFLMITYPNVHTLDIRVPKVVDLDLLHIYFKFPALEKLVIKNCDWVSGAYIDKFRKLRKLYLIDCRWLSVYHIEEILDGHLTKLVRLNVSGYRVLYPPIALLISDTMKTQLTHLSFTPRILTLSLVRCLQQMVNLKTVRWEFSTAEPMDNIHMPGWLHFYKNLGSKIVELTCHNINEEYFFDSVGFINEDEDVLFFTALKIFRIVGYVYEHPVSRLANLLIHAPLEEFHLSEETESFDIENRFVEMFEWVELIKKSPNLKLIRFKSQGFDVDKIMRFYHMAINTRLDHTQIPRNVPLKVILIDSNMIRPIHEVFMEVKRILETDELYQQQNTVKAEIKYEFYYPYPDISYIMHTFSRNQLETN